MRPQRTLVALAICGLISPVALAQRGSGHGGGQSAGGHASSGSTHGPSGGGHSTSGHSGSGRGGGRVPGAHDGGRVRPRAPGVQRHFVPPDPTNPAGFNLRVPNPTVFGSAALPMPAPGGDIFRARPNTYGRSFGMRSGLGSGFAGGPFFFGDGSVAASEPGDDINAASAPAPSALPPEPATIIAAGPPASGDPADVNDLHRHGEIRFDVEPLTAQVFVDGTPEGTIADFYHSLVGLSLPAGSHHLELRAPGYETVTADMTVIAGRTVRYRGRMNVASQK